MYKVLAFVLSMLISSAALAQTTTDPEGQAFPSQKRVVCGKNSDVLASLKKSGFDNISSGLVKTESGEVIAAIQVWIDKKNDFFITETVNGKGFTCFVALGEEYTPAKKTTPKKK